MEKIIIDTCVILDIIITSRPRHKMAQKLYNRILKGNVTLQAPFIAKFEISSGWKQEKLESFVKPTKIISLKNPMKIQFVPIDQNFFERYFDLQIPYSKASDLLFISMAKKENVPLLCEDKKMIKTAKTIKIDVYTIKDLLQKLN